MAIKAPPPTAAAPNRFSQRHFGSNHCVRSKQPPTPELSRAEGVGLNDLSGLSRHVLREQECRTKPEPEALSIRDGDLQRLRVSVPVVTNVFDR